MTRVTTMKATQYAASCRVGTRAVGQAPATQHRRQVVGEGRGTEGRGQEAGQGDPDLDGGEEAVGVGVQGGDLLAAPAALGQRLDLALAQRHQRDLRPGEEAAEHEEEAHEQGIGERSVHGVPHVPGGSSRHAGLEQPSIRTA